MEQALLMILLFFIMIMMIFMIILMNRQNNRKNQEEMDKMKYQVREDLMTFQSNLLTILRSDINLLNENTSNKMLKMEHHVNEQLHTNLTTTSKAFQEVMKQVIVINQTQDQLKSLSGDIGSLHRILNDKKTRGIYGEIELYSLLESAFGDNRQRYATQYQLSNHSIVDAMIFESGALGNIPIDSKFPLENFNRLQEHGISATQRKTLLNEFRNDVKKHIQSIASKYIIPNETSEFAYMFIPSEAIFSYINANLIDVVHYSYEKKVYLVSPTTLMAYLTAIKAMYLKQKKNEKIQDIQEALNKLSVEFERFVKRYESVANDYERTYKDMKDVLISARKIANRFKQIESVELDSKDKE
ncbi:MAG: DNA recombination protein RmuC [Erysipelotrichia bacterium]|nr:DNA recombination protein RmuC [Erysipelotrichia bacterium]NCC54905.1 DNA recombination protein RmuC [Erysipelotrichia bacterium]